MHQKNYYLYRHIRLDNYIPFYVGIGSKDGYVSNNVYFRAYSKYGRGKIWNRIVKKNNNTFKVEILLESDDCDFIKQKEIEFIKLYGRIDLGLGSLSNLTDGGEGCKGIIVTKERKEKLKITHAGHSWTKGLKWSEESKSKFSEQCKERKISPLFFEKGKETRDSQEFKDMMKVKMKNRPLSLETRQRISISHTGLKQSPDTVEKRVSKTRNRIRTEEQKKRIVEGRKYRNTYIQFSIDNKSLKEWERSELLEYGYKVDSVSSACYNGRTYKGFLWKTNKISNTEERI